MMNEAVSWVSKEYYDISFVNCEDIHTFAAFYKIIFKQKPNTSK